MLRLVIATRKSRLALWQASYVKARLEAQHAGARVELLPLSTRGDELLEARLDEAGGKGLFVKELERALADGRAHLAVHSMKDVPALLPPGFVIAAVTAREDPRDALVSPRFRTLAELPPGARVGTASLRREAQLAMLGRNLRFGLLRGNVETRLAKLDAGEFDAIVLAAAGLARLGLAQRIGSRIAPEDMLPAPGQGALAIECREDDAQTLSAVRELNDAATAACVVAERAVSAALGGNCTIPLGAYAEPQGPRLRLRALVAARDGARVARAQVEGHASEADVLGQEAAETLRRHGAMEILAGLGK